MLLQALATILPESRNEITKENKSTVDRVIHSIVGVQYKDCSRTWKEVKKMIAKDEEAFISKLKAALTVT